MPRKDEILSELLARKTREIVARSGNYAAFLRTAARNYKYTFREQVLIHAQRPDATACAEIDIWNRLGRRVNRGATGIALLRDPSLSYRIRYVFDISDTNSRENRDISLWQMKPEYENEVIQALQDKFLLNRDGSFLDAVEILSRQLAEEAAGDCLPDLLNNKKDSFLEELDNNSIARWFKDAVSESVRYMVLHRCGYAPELDSDVSGCILDFNTEITASILGSAASTLSQSVLREIGVTVKSLERQQSRTFDSFGDTVYNEARKNDERSQNNGTDLQNAGRLPSTQPDSPGESQGGQVRDAAPQLPPQAPGGAVHRDADGGHAERPSGGGGPGGQPDAGAADNSDGPGAGRDGRTESPGSDAVGPADEQHPAGRRGDHLQSADLRVIEESPLPSVEEQVSFLDGGFSVPEEAQQAFFPQLQLPQQVIDEALCMGFNDRDSRKIICAYFMKDKPDNADFLQRSYGTNGAGLIIQDQDYAVWYDPEGIRISPGHTVRNLHTTLVTWEQAAKRIRELLDMGRYIPKDELEQVPAFERRRIAQSLAFAVRECSAQVKEDGYLPLTAKTYSSNRGFPEIEAQMQRLLESPDTLKQLIDEWTLFAAAHANDRSLMVIRLYNPAELLQKLEDLQRIPLTFTAAEGFDSLRRYFISDDEINQALRGHESEFRSRLDVFSFFIRNTDAKEREKFLKRQHGEYSGYHGGNDNRVYDSTGFFFSHGSIGAPYAQVNMKWPAVTKWVSNMISAGVYLYPSDTDKMADYEINQLARQIMSFFSNAPDGFQRPTPRSDFDYWEGVAEIQEQLSAPEQVNTIYISMMQPLMEATQPSDRSFEIRKRGMEAMESYLAGTFSVFGKDHTIRPLARQAVNEDLEKAKELITEFCAEEYDSEPDFSDLRKVDIAYTTITDEEVPVQVSVDLMDFKLDRYIDGIIVDSRKYSSLKELTEQELTDPDFDELTAFSEEQLAKVALHGIQNKVVQRLTDNGEEIQIQLHVNGFYYNHYGMTDGTARYIDGPFDTLEDAAEEVHNYHPHAAQVVDSAPDMEEDTFDDVDPQQVREELAKRGIVDGKLVDPEALENTPFIRQVMADAGAAEPPPSLPVLPHSQDRPHALHPGVSADDRRNYHISANDLGIGVPIERFYHNVHAIELLHKLESENRLATPDEQDILSQYVGWGGLPQFFEETNAHYGELKALLSEDEYTAARESTLTAFYTPPVVIRAMYQGLANLGFQTGNILEPSCGVGNFMGLLPENMGNSKMYGVELGSISGRIAQQLYQKNKIAVQGFEKTDLPDSFFDVAIGNVPFGQFKVLDKKRTIRQRVTITSVDTASEALALSLAEKAKVDMPYMMELTHKNEDAILSDLRGVIFLNPAHDGNEDVAHKYLPADEYLSGNVREKLRTARLFAEKDERYVVNVQSLEAVQPVDLTAGEITVRLGAAWLPPDVIQNFMFELLRTPYIHKRNIKVHYSTYTGEWNIEGKSLDKTNVRSDSTFGTERINAYRIIEETLNLRDVRIFDYKYDRDGRRIAILNAKQTAIAQGKQEQIKQEFADWIWADPNRRERLTALYNEKFNSIRPREYDGSHLNFVGINPEIALRPHQVNAIAHILYGGNTLLAHTVGAGKTFEMVAAAQESKRLGLCQKSLFVVPNHLTEQWASEYLQLYPAANILVATKKDFETKNRKRFCSRIATGDYDAIIVGHSQFEKIPMSPERQRFILEQQKQEILDGIQELKRNNGDNFSVKQLERSKKSIQQKLERLNDQSRKDDVITFEELGVDRIFVDEAHMFKNLAAFTKMRNVAGISQTEAQKSSDLYMKCRYLDELTGGRGVVFATGTPISNSMVELYTMQKYLQYHTLKEKGLLHFDAWASTFGETVTAIELAPEGYTLVGR